MCYLTAICESIFIFEVIDGVGPFFQRPQGRLYAPNGEEHYRHCNTKRRSLALASFERRCSFGEIGNPPTSNAVGYHGPDCHGTIDLRPLLPDNANQVERNRICHRIRTKEERAAKDGSK